MSSEARGARPAAPCPAHDKCKRRGVGRPRGPEPAPRDRHVFYLHAPAPLAPCLAPCPAPVRLPGRAPPPPGPDWDRPRPAPVRRFRPRFSRGEPPRPRPKRERRSGSLLPPPYIGSPPRASTATRRPRPNAGSRPAAPGAYQVAVARVVSPEAARRRSSLAPQTSRCHEVRRPRRRPRGPCPARRGR